ncbi:MAG: hypothetical protein M3Q71_21885 [Chloroflexota bacterium]|nr:hypothetical protein [Chloroflexota bacterium]
MADDQQGPDDVARQTTGDPIHGIPTGQRVTTDTTEERLTSPTPGHTDESESGVEDKTLHQRFGDLSPDELSQLSILDYGTPLDQGTIYVDLDDLARGPFKALGGQSAGLGNRFVAKRDTDYELWNKLVGQHTEAEVERPAGVE